VRQHRSPEAPWRLKAENDALREVLHDLGIDVRIQHRGDQLDIEARRFDDRWGRASDRVQ
jgi:hypothetical protein